MIRPNMIRLISLAFTAVLISACAQLATVKNVEPLPPAEGTTSAGSFSTEREARRDPEASLSQDLDICSKAWSDLKRDPANSGARQLYNYSVARIVSLLQATGKLERAGSVTIGTGANAYKLTFASELKAFADPRKCHFVPADELAISGKDFQQRVRRDGIGAPVLAAQPLRSILFGSGRCFEIKIPALGDFTTASIGTAA